MLKPPQQLPASVTKKIDKEQETFEQVRRQGPVVELKPQEPAVRDPVRVELLKGSKEPTISTSTVTRVLVKSNYHNQKQEEVNNSTKTKNNTHQTQQKRRLLLQGHSPPFRFVLFILTFAAAVISAATMIWYKNLQAFGPIAFGHGASATSSSPTSSSILYETISPKSNPIMMLKTAKTQPAVTVTPITTSLSSSLPTKPQQEKTHTDSKPLDAPDYSEFTLSRFLPFAVDKDYPDGPALANVPYMRLAFEGEDVVAAVDTGSCGFMYSAADLKTWDSSWEQKYEAGWEYLSSSKLLYTGVWVPVNVSFPDAVDIVNQEQDVVDLTLEPTEGGEEALRKRIVTTQRPAKVVSNIKILVVTRKVKCPDWNNEDGPNYRPGGKNTFPPKYMPKGIRYLGIGFGRQIDGMPQATPDKNIMLNIVNVDGKHVIPSSSSSSSRSSRSGSKMRTGYIVTKHGIYVGLTKENSKNFKVQKLQRRQGSKDGRDWSMARMCVSVDGETCAKGNLLVDTGIRQMYLTVPTRMPVNRHARKNPSSGATSRVLDDGSLVKVDFGSAGSYSFTVGEGSIEEPTMVATMTSDKKEPWVNTGCHFLKKFDIMFDADPTKGGYFGVRECL